MTETAPEPLLRRIFADILGRDIAPTDRPVRDTEAAWDSLKHVELILTVESALGIRFSEVEITSFDSFDAILAAVTSHGAP